MCVFVNLFNFPFFFAVISFHHKFQISKRKKRNLNCFALLMNSKKKFFFYFFTPSLIILIAWRTDWMLWKDKTSSSTSSRRRRREWKTICIRSRVQSLGGINTPTKQPTKLIKMGFFCIHFLGVDEYKLTIDQVNSCSNIHVQWKKNNNIHKMMHQYTRATSHRTAPHGLSHVILH